MATDVTENRFDAIPRDTRVVRAQWNTRNPQDTLAMLVGRQVRAEVIKLAFHLAKSTFSGERASIERNYDKMLTANLVPMLLRVPVPRLKEIEIFVQNGQNEKGLTPAKNGSKNKIA